MQYDVVVVGSGAAGLTAALSAARGGAKVAVLERSNVFGGTTTFSGGSMWMPNNRFMAKAGMADSREEALTYIKRLTLGRVPAALVGRYVDQCNNLVAFLEAETNIDLDCNPYHPDYHSEFPGGKPFGRTVQGYLYEVSRLGDFKDRIRIRVGAPPLPLNIPLNRFDGDKWGRHVTDLSKLGLDIPTKRRPEGTVAGGRALIGELMEGCLKNGVDLISDTRAFRLLRNGNRIIGVAAKQAGSSVQFGARLGVVLATAGFEWNPKLVDRFLGVPMVAPSSPPTNEGDGLLMAMEVGAALGNMTEAWWGPTMTVPGEMGEGKQLARNTNDLRGLPGCIIVNRRGKRFVGEAINYNDFTKALMVFDPFAYEYTNVPSYLILDAEYRRSYTIATVTPDQETPAWLTEADSLRGLAERIGVDPDGLEQQVAEFNEHAEQGIDPIFHRGESAYDRFRGNRLLANPSIRPIG
ncbi:MAG: FAD-dependent oxidoreductase, partial [Chloroflexi bacterium]|nr:FAD-dependent oxidoreductase [Chloroflexota bacterium]